MSKAMKIKKLKNYGIPSYIVDIWEKNYSPCLLPLQEEAVRYYGVLNYGEGSARLPRRFAPRNDRGVMRKCVCYTPLQERVTLVKYVTSHLATTKKRGTSQ